MCGTECVVYEDIAESSKLLGEFFVVLCFACVETCVFNENDLAFFKSSNLSLCIFANCVCCECYDTAEELIESVCNDLEREFCNIALCFFESLCCCCFLLFSGEFCNFSKFLLCELEALFKYSVGFAHVRAKNNLCTLAYEIFDRGESFYDSLVACDNAVFNRNVKVASYKDFFAFDINVFNGFLVVSHFFLPPKKFYQYYFITIYIIFQ